jgi:pyrophosphate--fructose-6-phosphate 1-phosphotransferase
MRCIEFPRIKGGKPFNQSTPWFQEMLAAIGQTEATEAYPVDME